MGAGGVEWERIGREVVYEGRVVDVHRDRVRLKSPDGERETDYDVVHHPGAAAIVPLFEDGTVALVNQFRYVVGGMVWEIPAGSLDQGESYLACAGRELEEEIGHKAERWTPLATFYTTPGFSDEEMRLFLAEALSPGTSALEEDEALEVVRIPFAGALEWAAAGKIHDAKTLVGLYAARAHLEATGRWPLGRVAS